MNTWRSRSSRSAKLIAGSIPIGSAERDQHRPDRQSLALGPSQQPHAAQEQRQTEHTEGCAAAIGFLQMKRWGHQWMIVTCWMGLVIWCGYVFNMTMYADVRYAGVVLPVIGWWLYDIFYITPFLAIPYLHTVNREIFSD